MGFNALDVLNHAPKDFKILEIRGLLVAEKGAETIRPIHPTLSANRMRDEDGAAEVPAKVQEQAQESWILRRWVWAVWPLLEKLMEYKGDWMNETKGAPMMVSSIIATVTFAAAIAPPGGVWQEDTTYSCDNSPSCQICNNESICYAGSAVLGSYYPYDYIRFMKYDMTSFISALVVLFLLMSGFPLNNKFCLWLLSLAMCVTVSFLGRTFLLAMWLTIPYEMMSDFDRWKTVSYDVWRATVCAVALCLLGFGTCTKALG